MHSSCFTERSQKLNLIIFARFERCFLILPSKNTKGELREIFTRTAVSE